MNGILFDLDGTLWNACETMLDSWNRTLAEKFPELHRSLTLPELQGVMGKTKEEIARLFFPGAPFERAVQAVETACADEVPVLRERGGVLYPGVPALLARLKGRYLVGIVSNCQCGYIETFLAAHQLEEYVDGFLCEGMTHQSKGENIRTLADQLGAKRTVYVGDTESDEVAARAAGALFCHAAYGFGGATAPDGVVAAPGELPALLKKWGI